MIILNDIMKGIVNQIESHFFVMQPICKRKVRNEEQ